MVGLKRQRNSRRATMLALCCLFSLLVTEASQAASDGSLVSVAVEIINKVEFGALVTMDADGQPQVRTMQPFSPESDLTIWMATRQGTRKLEQLRRNARSTLYFSDPTGPSYVTLMGHIELVEAPTDRSGHWNPQWQNFYDDGPRGDDYVLLRFVTDRLELVSVPHKIAASPKSWKPAIVELSAGREP